MFKTNVAVWNFMLTGKKQQQRSIFRRESNGLTGSEPNDCTWLKLEALYSSKETNITDNKQSSLMTAAKKHLENSSISSEATKRTDRKKKNRNRKGYLNMKLMLN